ncbi:MAG: HAD family hydrolase [Peptococcus niger]
MDSNQHVISCFKYAFRKFRRVRQHGGNHRYLRHSLKALQMMRPAAAQDLLRTYRAESDRRGQGDIVVIPQAQETLAALKARQAGIAVVTSKKRVNAYKSLDALGLSPYLDVFVGPEDTDVHKPDPKPVNIALGRLQAAPETALMIGDSAHDIEAARRAGIKTCGVAFAAI